MVPPRSKRFRHVRHRQEYGRHGRGHVGGEWSAVDEPGHGRQLDGERCEENGAGEVLGGGAAKERVSEKDGGAQGERCCECYNDA
ncbi:MAG: hypothetical protein LUO93_11160 [Methanomicrobiales archaeon]|nr:hypothetical protein [Methanomicrobiales archaeon]